MNDHDPEDRREQWTTITNSAGTPLIRVVGFPPGDKRFVIVECPDDQGRDEWYGPMLYPDHLIALVTAIVEYGGPLVRMGVERALFAATDRPMTDEETRP